MKALILSITLFFCAHANAQDYFQQQVRYDITADFNDQEKSITAFEKIVYKNNSETTLDFIWFHIWPNAYKSNNTALFQQLKNDEVRGKKKSVAGIGYIDGLSFKINDAAAKTEAHPNPDYIDIVKLLLNKPLKPGDSITITTPFKTVLPPYFSRSGYSDGEFMACQWYPKPAVFDKEGWHEFPYLDMGEFYAEIADYNVKLTLPSDYIVGATGTMLTAYELNTYKTIGAKNTVNRTNSPALYTPENKDAKKTLSWFALQVPDFAWFADKNFIVQYDTIMLPGQKPIDAFTYYHNKKNSLWQKSIDFVKDAVHHYSTWIGDYVYPTVQAVEGPKNNLSGGMEYPMITLITSPDAKEESLDGVIAHEVGHNWFMGMLGSNERRHGWMDEGLNTYFQFRYEAEKYRSNSIFGDAIPAEVKNNTPERFQELTYLAMAQGIPFDDEIDVAATEKSKSDPYSTAIYIKTAVWLNLIEQAIGRKKLDEAMHNYFNKWKFKHPQPEDMQNAFEEVAGSMQSYFPMLYQKGKLE